MKVHLVRFPNPLRVTGGSGNLTKVHHSIDHDGGDNDTIGDADETVNEVIFNQDWEFYAMKLECY